MKKLFLLAVSLAALWSCDKAETIQPAAQVPATKATHLTGNVSIAFASFSTGPQMQAHISFSPAVYIPCTVYFTVNKVYIVQEGFEEYGSASVETIISSGNSNYSENVPARRGMYTYVDMSSFQTVPDLSGQYNIQWSVSGLPTEDPESGGSTPMYCGGGCGHITGTCPSSCNCGCIFDSTQLRRVPQLP